LIWHNRPPATSLTTTVWGCFIVAGLRARYDALSTRRTEDSMGHPFSAQVSLTFQLGQLLRNKIIRGDLSAGDRLAPETRLAEEYGVSVITVQRALKELERDGLITRHRGRGTFVSQLPDHLAHPPERQILSAMFMDEFSDDTEILEWKLIDRPAHLQGFGPDVAVVKHLRRRVFRHGRPWSIGSIFVLPEAAGGLREADLRRFPMFRLLREKAGCHLKDVDLEFFTQVPTPEICAALQIDPVSPVMAFHGCLRDSDDRVLTVLDLHYRGDGFSVRWTQALS